MANIFWDSWFSENEVGTYLASCGRDVRVSQLARIVGNPANLILRDRVRIDDFVQIVVGDALVEIGDNVHISNHASLHGQGGITVCANARVSAGARVFSISDALAQAPGKKDQAEVVIGPECIIGANTVLLPGVTMENGSVVGAGSVVVAGETLRAWRCYGGVPVMPLRKRARP